MNNALLRKNAFCSYCGAPFVSRELLCSACGCRTFENPTPTAFLFVPVAGEGLLLVRRACEPRRGKLTFPGGYISLGELWQTAAARELFEETQIEIAAESIADACARSSRSLVMIFGMAPPQPPELLAEFTPNDEVVELVVARSPTEHAHDMAWELDQEMVDWYFCHHAAHAPHAGAS